jgi:glycosyltransferase involved in cell wall biosynthesis
MTSENNLKIAFSRGLLIYIPAYNCADYIVSVVDDIPADILQLAEILIVDNCSTDDTVARVQKARDENRWSAPVHLIQPETNLGYSGSQKLAYSIALKSTSVKRVVMLHGDGQYPPELLSEFLPYVESDYGVVYGYRDKSLYPVKEETPVMTYRVIKVLSAIESFVTGHHRKEWHTGFVMYSREFLLKVDLDGLTDTYHIDGHLQFVAGELEEQVKPIPIWKRYKGYAPLAGLKRFSYIFHVLRLSVLFRIQKLKKFDTVVTSEVRQFSILSGDPGTRRLSEKT